MSAPNARTVIAEFLTELLLQPDENGSPGEWFDGDIADEARQALADLKAAAGGCRFIVIDTEGCDGDGTVMGLEQPHEHGPDGDWFAGVIDTPADGYSVDMWHVDAHAEPLYRLTTPVDATGSGGDTATLPQDGPAGARMDGRDPETGTGQISAPPADRVTDLMEALERSIADAKAARERPAAERKVHQTEGE